MSAFEPGAVIDGYRLIRVIGAGGFGDVWLCFSETLHHHFALKVIRQSQAGHSDRELEAVQKFKQLGLGNSATGIMPIEHVGTTGGHLYYIMPLADGTAKTPTDPDWRPLTLGALIRSRREAADWFTSGQILTWLTPIVRAAETINTTGLIHRDIKPDNILFLRGNPVLSDISLLREDDELITEIGTFGFRAPTSYAESGGKPDMFALAVTLYMFLTGNAPDKIGRANFRWPPQGEISLSASEHQEWLRLHRVIFRATAEKPADRYLTFSGMADALCERGSLSAKPTPPVQRIKKTAANVAISLALVLAAAGIWFSRSKSKATSDLSLSPPTQKSDQKSSAEVWRPYDEVISSIQTSLEDYHRKWMPLETSAEEALEQLKPAPATIETLDATVKILQPLVVKAKSLRSDIEKNQREFWEEKLPSAYQAAVATDSSPTAWREAQKRDKESAELMEQWNEILSAIRVGPASWTGPLYETLAYFKALERPPRPLKQPTSSAQWRAWKDDMRSYEAQKAETGSKSEQIAQVEKALDAMR